MILIPIVLSNQFNNNNCSRSYSIHLATYILHVGGTADAGADADANADADAITLFL